jgi:hypothetical protein
MITIKGKVKSSGKYIGSVLGLTGIVALVAFFTLGQPLPTIAGSHNGPPASVASSGASPTSAAPRTTAVVPRRMIVADSGRFAGTGDGSEGSWVGQ